MTDTADDVPYASIRDTGIAALTLVASALPCTATHAQLPQYPNKPIRIITAEYGGGVDFASRLVAQALAPALGQPVVVNNRSGGSSISGELLTKSTPDGHTLLVASGTLWIGPYLQKTSYDMMRDFAPITLISRAPNLLVVHPSVPVKSVKDLIALARTKPGELNYASASIGSSPHLAPELFKAMADINIVRVPYKGSAQGLMDVLAGQVQLMFPVSAGAAPHVTSGKLRALAITTSQPSPLFADLPTVAASGVPGYESGTINAMFAPFRTPAVIVSRLNRQVVQILRRADVRDRFLGIGVEPAGTSPDELMATVKSEMARLGKVIRDAGIKPE